MLIIGFGSVEEDLRNEVRTALLAAGPERYDSVLEPYNTAADKYDKQSRDEAPERYSRIWCYDGNIIFHHTHRRHPFSPDGWAMLQVEESLT